jgi:SPX domain protein involved in polyphosphate accumulation
VHDWDDADEAAFLHMLEQELDKIHDFQLSKVRPARTPAVLHR